MPSLVAVQKAIWARLDNQLAYGVYDDVPQGTTMPYVTLGNKTETDDLIFGAAGDEAFFDVHVWSDALGDLEALTIANLVRGALDGHTLTLAAGTQRLLKHDWTNTVRATTGTERQVVLRYKCQVDR